MKKITLILLALFSFHAHSSLCEEELSEFEKESAAIEQKNQNKLRAEIDALAEKKGLQGSEKSSIYFEVAKAPELQQLTEAKLSLVNQLMEHTLAGECHKLKSVLDKSIALSEKEWKESLKIIKSMQ